jgi:hypothetical protein
VYFTAGRLLLSLLLHSKYATPLRPLYKAVRGSRPMPAKEALEVAVPPLPSIGQLCGH